MAVTELVLSLGGLAALVYLAWSIARGAEL